MDYISCLTYINYEFENNTNEYTKVLDVNVLPRYNYLIQLHYIKHYLFL